MRTQHRSSDWFPYLGLVRLRGAAAFVALWVWVGRRGVCAQVGLRGQAYAVLLAPRRHLHGGELSCVQLLRGADRRVDRPKDGVKKGSGGWTGRKGEGGKGERGVGEGEK